MRVGRGFGHMVVAHQGEHAAMLRRAGEIGVAEDVAGAVDARSLAVPERKHAVMLAFAEQFRLLRAPAGGGGEFLVEAGLEDDVRLGKLLLGPPELQVEAAERRAAIAGNEAGRVQPRAPVALALHQKHAHDRLRARQEDALLAQIELVVERDVVKRHQQFLCGSRAQFARPTSGRVAAVFLRHAGKVKQNQRARQRATVGWRSPSRRNEMTLAKRWTHDPFAACKLESAGCRRRQGDSSGRTRFSLAIRQLAVRMAGEFRIGRVDRARRPAACPAAASWSSRRGHRRLDRLHDLAVGAFDADRDRIGPVP